MPQYNFEHKWAHKNTDLSHVSLDILFTLYIRNVHHARTQQHHVYVFGAQGRIQKNALFQCRCLNSRTRANGVLTGANA